MLDGDPMLFTKSFECNLAFHGVFQVDRLLEPDKSQASCLVDVDSGMAIPLACWFAQHLGNEPRSWQGHHVNGDAFTQLSNWVVPPSLHLRSWTSMVSWCSSHKNAWQFGIGQVARCLGRMPNLAMAWIHLSEMCPYC